MRQDFFLNLLTSQGGAVMSDFFPLFSFIVLLGN